MEIADFRFDGIELEIFGNGIRGNGLSSIETYDLTEFIKPVPTEICGNGY